MCNIAGYVGAENAAPILIEMLRRQQHYNGGMCTGIATIWQGHILWRKVVGDVDTLLRTTDALYLPGSVGIAHSRPSGTPKTYGFAHPAVSGEEDMALVANGTAHGLLLDAASIQKMTTELEEEGCVFRSAHYPGDPKKTHLKDGGNISNVDTRMYLARRQYNKGKTLTESMAIAATHYYKDAAMAAIHVREADRIVAVRTSRPLCTYTDASGTYLASTCFAFPDEAMEQAEMLPLMQACAITRSGVEYGEKMVGVDIPAEVDDAVLEESYRRIVALLREKPMYFDEIELTLWHKMRDIFPGDHILIQDARLVYDVLYRLRKEGALKSELRTLESGRQTYFFSV